MKKIIIVGVYDRISDALYDEITARLHEVYSYRALATLDDVGINRPVSAALCFCLDNLFGDQQL